LDQKFPTVWEKCQKISGVIFFDSHCIFKIHSQLLRYFAHRHTDHYQNITSLTVIIVFSLLGRAISLLSPLFRNSSWTTTALLTRLWDDPYTAFDGCIVGRFVYWPGKSGMRMPRLLSYLLDAVNQSINQSINQFFWRQRTTRDDIMQIINCTRLSLLPRHQDMVCTNRCPDSPQRANVT